MPSPTTLATASSRAPRHLGQLALASTAAAATIIAATLLWTGPPAHGDETGEGVTAQEVAVALEGVSGGLVKDAAEPSPSSTDSALRVQVPAAPSDGISLSAGDFDLSISLPNTEASENGLLLADGTTVYPSDGASSNAVIPTEGGVQLLSVIESRDAAQLYSYDLTFPSNHRLEATPDGGARIVDAQGLTKVEFEAAWAEDAAGLAVPTHYSVEGNTLTQVVSHKEMENVSYPIVADPLPVIVFVVTGLALVAVAALALGVGAWIVLSWWNTCQAKGKYPELSTKNGFTARCVN